MRKGLQQLWYQRYPIPQRNVSFKVFKGFGNGGDRVVQTEEPQDANQQWPGFRILVQTSSLAKRSIRLVVVAELRDEQPLRVKISAF